MLAWSWVWPSTVPAETYGDTTTAGTRGPSMVKSNAAYDAYVDDGDTDFARGESLIAMVYEALRANPDVFQRTLLLITYDEHGGLYDHVPPCSSYVMSRRVR